MLKRIKNVMNIRLKRSMEKNDIEMQDLKKMKNRGIILVDVRSPQEYNEGHLEDAICIPEYELKKRAKNELKDRSATIVVYCSTGSRSKKAKKILETMGYDNVYNLYNGMENY